jgi:predicted AAA+ superfamily ATPase
MYNGLMDIRFQPNNAHLTAPEDFRKMDPHLRRLYAEKLVYRADLIDKIPVNTPGIYSLTGGRQIGKTTLLKQWMEYLLALGTPPQSIYFLSGELISDYQSLYTLIQNQLNTMPIEKLKYCIIDEITYIRDWDRAIKYLADIGVLENVVLVISGSDTVLIQDARKRFPGRRGKADQVDFHYYPLSFRETVLLKGSDADNIDELFNEFNHYLIHGGFLSAINEFVSHERISTASLTTYSDWIRGDMLKQNKKELFLREIIGAIIKHYMKQVSWDNLVKELSIDHTQTVADYMAILGSMDAAFVQFALREDTLSPAPKKRKKLMFCDPFIYHAMRAWLTPQDSPFENQLLPLLANPVDCADLVEACVVTHIRRHFPTYYIKAEGEVDVAYVKNERFFPIEIKWTSQTRPKDLKQILKYPQGEIFVRQRQVSHIQHLPTTPLPVALFHEIWLNGSNC